MNDSRRCCDLTYDLFLPTLLFTALGGMTWAIRGCSGFGASAGCIFAGVAWGAAWWYLAYEPMGDQTRRYTSAWIVLALTLGFGFAGAQGWMQWPSFFEGRLVTNYDKREWLPISPGYGFLWLFIAGTFWAGLGACALAWCGSLRETRIWHWVLRIACGIGGAQLVWHLYQAYPACFLPMYAEFESRYKDLDANPSLKRLINDCGEAMWHLGYYLGFLLFELLRRDWKNVVLIVTVGVLNGAGWAALQNWKWAHKVWPQSDFNFWRCWESSGGLSIGFAYGIAYFLVNRRMSAKERALVADRRAVSGPNFEWFLVFCGLTAYLSRFLRIQTAGWGPYYLSVLYGFATIYYLVNRKSSRDAGRGSAVIGWAAVVLGLAFLLGNFLPFADARGQETRVQRWLVQSVGNPLSWFERTVGNHLPWLGPYRSQYRLFYNTGVFVLGLVWYLINRRRFEAEKLPSTPPAGDPHLERFGLYLGLLTGLGLSIRSGAKGWFNIYYGDERTWSGVLWQDLGPAYLVCLLAIAAWILFRARRQISSGTLFPRAYAAFWLVLIVQNVIAQMVTGPLTSWNEVAFSIYYVLLFFITAVIAIHYRTVKMLAG